MGLNSLEGNLIPLQCFTCARHFHAHINRLSISCDHYAINENCLTVSKPLDKLLHEINKRNSFNKKKIGKVRSMIKSWNKEKKFEPKKRKIKLIKSNKIYIKTNRIYHKWQLGFTSLNKNPKRLSFLSTSLNIK